MRALFHTLLFSLTLLPLSGATVARDVNGNYASFGAGSENCDVYLEARKAGGGYLRAYEEWVSGHLTAYNLLLDNTYNIAGGTSPYELFADLDVICQENPDAALVQVLAARLEQLYNDRHNLSPGDRSGWDGFLEDIRDGAKGQTEEE